MQIIQDHSIVNSKCVHRWPIMLLLCVVTVTHFTYAQDAIQFSQYFSNQLAINPAYAGADNALSLTMVHRDQWTGVDGAPRTTTLTGHTLFKNAHTGIGASLVVDEINIHSNVSFSGVYSYRIKTGLDSYLSMGLQAGLNYVKSDYAALMGSIYDPDDPGMNMGTQTEMAFQVGSGMYFSNKKLEVGLSSPILYSSGKTPTASDSTNSPSMTPHYFLFTRYKIDVSDHVQLNPGFLLKGRPGQPLAVDINLDALINEVVMTGLSYRSFESLSAILRIKVLPQMKIGYAYDIPLSDVKRRSFNSHELMLNYIFQYENYNVKSPR